MLPFILCLYCGVVIMGAGHYLDLIVTMLFYGF